MASNKTFPLVALSPSNEPFTLIVSSENKLIDVIHTIMNHVDYRIKLSIITPSGELAVDERKTIGELSTPGVPLFRYSLIEPLPETDPALSHYSAETMQLIKESFPEYQILVLDSAQLLYKRLSAKASFSSDEQSLEYVKHTLSDGRQQDIGLNFISNQGMHGLFAKYITHDRHHNIRAILYQEEGKEGYQLDYLAEEIRKKYDGPMFNVFGWEKLSDADIYRKIIDAIKAQER